MEHVLFVFFLVLIVLTIQSATIVRLDITFLELRVLHAQIIALLAIRQHVTHV
jgi:hypothetical protein